MPHYYCNACGVRRNLVRRPPDDLINTTYQLDKFIKHTVLDPAHRLVSTFNSTSTGEYSDLVIKAVNAGSVEIDDRGRTNIICRAFRPTGHRYKSGQFVRVQTSVCVVLTSSTGEIHAFPDDEARFANRTCADCGALV